MRLKRKFVGSLLGKASSLLEERHRKRQLLLPQGLISPACVLHGASMSTELVLQEWVKQNEHESLDSS